MEISPTILFCLCIRMHNLKLERYQVCTHMCCIQIQYSIHGTYISVLLHTIRALYTHSIIHSIQFVMLSESVINDKINQEVADWGRLSEISTDLLAKRLGNKFVAMMSGHDTVEAMADVQPNMRMNGHELRGYDSSHVSDEWGTVMQHSGHDTFPSRPLTSNTISPKKQQQSPPPQWSVMEQWGDMFHKLDTDTNNLTHTMEHALCAIQVQQRVKKTVQYLNGIGENTPQFMDQLRTTTSEAAKAVLNVEAQSLITDLRNIDYFNIPEEDKQRQRAELRDLYAQDMEEKAMAAMHAQVAVTNHQPQMWPERTHESMSDGKQEKRAARPEETKEESLEHNANDHTKKARTTDGIYAITPRQHVVYSPVKINRSLLATGGDSMTDIE